MSKVMTVIGRLINKHGLCIVVSGVTVGGIIRFLRSCSDKARKEDRNKES